MADFSDTIEAQLPGLGKAVVIRGDMSDEEWEKHKADARKESRKGAPKQLENRLFGTSDLRTPAEKAYAGDHVELVNDRGTKTIIPRGDMTIKEWDQKIDKARENPNWVQIVRNGQRETNLKDTTEGRQMEADLAAQERQHAEESDGGAAPAQKMVAPLGQTEDDPVVTTATGGVIPGPAGAVVNPALMQGALRAVPGEQAKGLLPPEEELAPLPIIPPEGPQAPLSGAPSPVIQQAMDEAWKLGMPPGEITQQRQLDPTTKAGTTQSPLATEAVRQEKARNAEIDAQLQAEHFAKTQAMDTEERARIIREAEAGLRPWPEWAQRPPSPLAGMEANAPLVPPVPGQMSIAPPEPAGPTPEEALAAKYATALGSGAGASVGVSIPAPNMEGVQTLKDAREQMESANREAIAQAGQDLREYQVHAEYVRNQNEISLQTEQNIRGMAADEAQRIQNTIAATTDEIQRVAAAGTDPNRFWNNQDGLQKAMSVLAGMAFGFAGKGMEYLNHLDGLVERDIRVQQADRTAKIAGLETSLKAKFDARGFALTMGATRAEAEGLSRTARWQSLKSWADELGMKSKSRDVQMAAAKMSADFAGKIAESVDKVNQLAMDGTKIKASVATENARLAQHRLDQSFKVQMSMLRGPEKAVRYSPIIQGRLASIANALAAVEMGITLVKNSGLGDRVTRWTKEVYDSKEAALAGAYEMIKNEVTIKYTQGAIQKEEADRLLPLFGIRSGLYDATPRLEAAKKLLEAEMTALKKSGKESALGIGAEPVEGGYSGGSFTPSEE